MGFKVVNQARKIESSPMRCRGLLMTNQMAAIKHEPAS
jgi:hypothetical protein